VGFLGARARLERDGAIGPESAAIVRRELCRICYKSPR
jgi:hypothetical protein